MNIQSLARTGRLSYPLAEISDLRAKRRLG